MPKKLKTVSWSAGTEMTIIYVDVTLRIYTILHSIFTSETVQVANVFIAAIKTNKETANVLLCHAS